MPNEWQKHNQNHIKWMYATNKYDIKLFSDVSLNNRFYFIHQNIVNISIIIITFVFIPHFIQNKTIKEMDFH